MGRKYFCYFCVPCLRFIATTFWNDIDIKCRHFKIFDISHNCESIYVYSGNTYDSMIAIFSYGNQYTNSGLSFNSFNFGQ